jgi:23S rRNA pseudouridine1911/1915/1917 synthase
VSAEDEGTRLDRFISSCLPVLSRSFLQKAIETGDVLVDGTPVRPSYRLKENQSVTVVLHGEERRDIIPEDIPFVLVHEDEHLAVVDKPAGVVVHPGAGSKRATLVSGLLYRGIVPAPSDDPDRPGIVHRLDRDTTGLLVIAKSDEALLRLKEQFTAHTTERLYEGVCWGRLPEDEMVIDIPVGRHRSDRTRMSTRTDTGREAVTEVAVVRVFSHMTHARFRLQTGRTHQIRVHLSSRGHPIVGDPTYGSMKRLKELSHGSVHRAAKKLTRQALHAKILGFTHPISGEFLRFESALPEDIRRLIDALVKEERAYDHETERDWGEKT